MRFLLLFVLLLLPSLARAQVDQEKCLVNGTNDNRVSGTVEYVSYQHPYRDIKIAGYKLILLQPRCFESTDLETQKTMRSDIEEMAIQHDGRYTEFLQSYVGKTVTIIGTMQNTATIYYVATPQIDPDSIIACEVVPKSKDIGKC